MSHEKRDNCKEMSGKPLLEYLVGSELNTLYQGSEHALYCVRGTGHCFHLIYVRDDPFQLYHRYICIEIGSILHNRVQLIWVPCQELLM
jgi:hypothetical protein